MPCPVKEDPILTQDSYTWGEHITTHGAVESLCCTPEATVTLCANYTSKKKKKISTVIAKAIESKDSCSLFFPLGESCS